MEKTLNVGSPMLSPVARLTSPPPPYQCSGIVPPPRMWLRNRRAPSAESPCCSDAVTASHFSLLLWTRTLPGLGAEISRARALTSSGVAPSRVTSQMKARIRLERSSSPNMNWS